MSLEELKKIDAKNLPIGKLITMISRGHTIYLNHNLDELDINASQLHLLIKTDVRISSHLQIKVKKF